MPAAATTPSAEFAAEFEQFARREAQVPAPRDAVLFYGSSSIRFWETLPRDFPALEVVNRGFGGSTLADCLQEMERLVFPLNPRAIVLYAGENDLDQGAGAERLPQLFNEFATRVEARLGPIPLVFISLKPSPARVAILERIRRANTLMREAVGRRPNARFVEVFSLMLDAQGLPRRELFTADCLHMSRAGYQLWTAQTAPVLAELGCGVRQSSGALKFVDPVDPVDGVDSVDKLKAPQDGRPPKG